VSKYNYSKELKKPISLGNINFENILIRTLIRTGCRLSDLQIKLLKGKEDFSRRTVHIPVGDNIKIPCTVIEPKNQKINLPAIIYLHGGAFVLPLASLMIKNALYYAEHLQCRVFLPQYRLAPEYPFPIPLCDCYNAFNHITENADAYLIDKNNILIYGDSAGGCLAASVCHMLRDNKKCLPNAQMLIYPVTDNSVTSKSMEQYKNAAWTKTATVHMWNLYLKNGHAGMLGYAAPLHNSDFGNLPPAYIEAAQMDTLRDEALSYADKLKDTKIPVETYLVKGAYHGFDMDHTSPLVKKVLKHRIKVMRNYFAARKISDAFFHC
jgi:acetyl esterase